VLFPHFVSFLHNKISNEENLQRCSIWDPAQKKLDEEKQKHAGLAQEFGFGSTILHRFHGW
jgi:hypothetical protein